MYVHTQARFIFLPHVAWIIMMFFFEGLSGLNLSESQDGRPSFSPEGNWLVGVCRAGPIQPEAHVQRTEGSQWCHCCQVSFTPSLVFRRSTSVLLYGTSFLIDALWENTTNSAKVLSINSSKSLLLDDGCGFFLLVSKTTSIWGKFQSSLLWSYRPCSDRVEAQSHVNA